MVYKIEIKPLPPEQEQGHFRVLWEVWEVLEDPKGRTGSREKVSTGIVGNYTAEPFYTQSKTNLDVWTPKPLDAQYDILLKLAKEEAETFVDTLLVHSVSYEYPTKLDQVVEPVFTSG